MKPVFEMTLRRFTNGCEEYRGLCISCGRTATNVEPDARNYPCPKCHEEQVFGLEELLIMGKIVFK